MATNKSLILGSHPTAFPIPGKDLVIKESPIPTSPPDGGLILKTNYISYDPYLRGKMRPPNPASYTPGFKIGEPLTNNAISTVIASSSPRFKEGDVVIGGSEFSEYVVVGKERAEKEAIALGLSVLRNPLELDPVVFLGALGMPGLTAYSSFYEIGQPKQGNVVFVSAASGAVGQIVGQLAKREGLIVIGSVGSDEKLEFIKKELGFDAGFNYKKESPEEGLKRTLKELGKEGLDIYYDNVGGEHLDASLAALNTFGRIVSCGSVSQTSKVDGETYRIKNMPLVVGRRLTIRGFIVSDADMGPKYWKEHQENMQKWIKDGSLVVKVSITNGIDNAAAGLVGMLKGENFGKAVLKIADL
ncbi:hypothetical protein B0O99DRAFT_589152 [Bisporella sp. PMI_857]|nr:hypothetical protein B0O99DRAFT_589152 [Bisporella sp. PMI_857]